MHLLAESFFSKESSIFLIQPLIFHNKSYILCICWQISDKYQHIYIYIYQMKKFNNCIKSQYTTLVRNLCMPMDPDNILYILLYPKIFLFVVKRNEVVTERICSFLFLLGTYGYIVFSMCAQIFNRFRNYSKIIFPKK